MRADDFVTGDSARGAGQSSLVGTESTNAVNTGLVGSAAAIAKGRRGARREQTGNQCARIPCRT